MKKLNKKVVISVVTSASIAISSSILMKNKDCLLPFYYGIEKDNIVHDSNIYAFKRNDYDNISTYLSEQNYSVFADLIVNYDIIIPSIDNMVPQGITVMNEYFLISMYDYTKKSNSVICVLNKNGDLINVCYLNNNAHVGGISYDGINGLVWITQKNGKIDAYLPNSILNSKKALPIFLGLDVGQGLENYKYHWINSASFLAVNENKLFVGSFALNEPGFVKVYSISMDENMKKISLIYDDTFLIPDKCQGISFYRCDDVEYIVFSRSYGRDFSSILQICVYNTDNKDYYSNQEECVFIKTPEMMEQIIFHDDYLYGIFESGADPYLKDEGINNVFVLDAKKLIKTYKKNTSQ